MKKVLSIFAICLLSFLLVGCGCDKDKDKDKDKEDTQKNQIEKTIENLYTDDNKLVYDNGGIYKIVFYYNKDNEITGLEHYYEYKDEKTAEEQYNKDKEEFKNDASIKNISLSGKYVIYTFVGEQYEGKTVNEVKESYGFLVPVYEG